MKVAVSTRHSDYDAIVIGSGAGGGVAAAVLAEAGKSVLLLERGRDLSFEAVGRDHLRNQRMAVYGHNAGPDIDGNPRTLQADSFPIPVGEALGDLRLLRPHEPGYQNNAACVGSGTRVYAGQAWRFMPQDFRMASEYGVPEGSSLADWPIGYEDLLPYYEKVEWEIGICGDHRTMTHLPTYDKPYPMPALPLPHKSGVHKRGLEQLGWQWLRVPRLINSMPYNDRPGCINCQQCVGFACPADAKNGSHNTTVPRALRSGNCTLRAEVMAERLACSAGGRVIGVTIIDAAGQRQTLTADVVVLSCGAVETARLLLNSATPQEPSGIGNGGDQVGRNLQGHYYPGAAGLFPDVMFDGVGPGCSIATCQFNHGNDGIIGGGFLGDEDIVTPVTMWKRFYPPDAPRWGIEAKRFMRDNYRRINDVTGPVQEIPSPQARVSVNPKIKDKYGIPVVHLSGATHPETVRTARFMHERAKEWLRASGAIKVWGRPPPRYLSGGQHQAGSCRMGEDPAISVVDPFCRVHSHDNLFIADGSPHVTNGGFNPVETIMALAWRTAENIVAKW